MKYWYTVHAENEEPKTFGPIEVELIRPAKKAKRHIEPKRKSA